MVCKLCVRYFKHKHMPRKKRAEQSRKWTCNKRRGSFGGTDASRGGHLLIAAPPPVAAPDSDLQRVEEQEVADAMQASMREGHEQDKKRCRRANTGGAGPGGTSPSVVDFAEP